MAQRNNRLVYFLGFLVIVLPIIAGILVWQFVPGCKDGKTNNSGCQDKLSEDSSSTVRPPPVTEPSQTQTTTALFEDGPWKDLRLPDSIVPIHYHTSLYPDFYDNQETFYGNVTTELKVTKPTNVIMVHIKYLNISNTRLFNSSNLSGEIAIKRTFAYEPNEFWVVETNDLLTANSTVYLRMTFNGNLTRSIVGFYKSTYLNALTNKSSAIATTKFEPVAARRAFPCFDEPSIKAEYTVELIHQPDFTALSNMDAESTDPWIENNALSVTKFSRSKKMSTYLACFIVCDFKYLNGTSKNGVKVRLFAPSDRVNQTRYALEVAMTTVDLYTQMFNVSYPLPKLDLISIPDFVSGAMENWGLITFRETNILYDPSLSSTSNKQRVATVVAHEISHQWFGNLVTMAWWEDLWLNEGFASFMEYLGAAEHEPDWELMEYFLVGDLQPVMVTDAGLSSHPIVVHVTDPAQINAVFDSISYSKGCSIIRMLQSWMGKDAFFKGISGYLQDYSFQNARTDDLWTHLGNIENGISVKSVMDTWTKQMGLPYVNVTIQGSNVTLTQDRFLADSSIRYNKSDSEFGYTWFIKLDYTTNTGRQGSSWMKQDKAVTFGVGSNFNDDGWIKFNLNETGFYRVNYPEFMWKRLSNALNTDKTALTIADRSNLIDDVFNIARAGLVSYQVALNMTLYLDTEEDYLPWRSAQRALSYISSMLAFTGDASLMQDYKVCKISNRYDQLGWKTNGSHVERLLRSTAISLACGNGHEGCLKQANSMFKDWLYNGTAIDPDLRSLVYSYGMRSVSSSREWMMVWNKYLSEPVPQEKSKLRSALSDTRSISLLMRYIEFAKNKSYVRDQDYFTVLEDIAGNPVGRSLVWNWVRNNWQYLIDRFTLYSRYFGRLIPSVVSGFNTENELDEVKSFFRKYPDAGAGENGRKQALESIERNINWMKMNKDDVVTWLQDHISSSSFCS